MFLSALQKQNTALISSAVQLLKDGVVLPDTYIIDVDQFRVNAKCIKQKADSFNVRLYAMTKQFGRNPVLAKILTEELGFDGVVCVDFKEARFFYQQGIVVSHVGHLVQPPSQFIKQLIEDIKPEIITVYSLEKAQELSSAANKANHEQMVLIKFFQEGDLLYPNQEAGFPLSTLAETLKAIHNLPNLTVAGITHFPCFLYDSKKKVTLPTSNLFTALSAISQAEALGYSMLHRNFPSSSSCETIPLIHEYAGTHAEPGHALTGTTPANHDASQEEKVALLYLTEVSHHFDGRSYCYGGGNYARSQINGALVFDEKAPKGRFLSLSSHDVNNIDYYFQLNGQSAVGTPVVMAFRTQIFVTRSDVALVEGISTSQPKLLGLFDTQGRQIQR